MNSFFAPGRTELAGNHTDHQKGRVLASAVDKGIHAFVEPNFDNVARIRSAGFPDMDINLLDLDVHPGGIRIVGGSGSRRCIGNVRYRCELRRL